MNDAVQKYLQAATGLTNLTKAKAESIAKQLVRQGEVATDNVGELVDDLLERQRKNREAVTALVKAETQRAIRAMGLATNTEVERLEKQVSDLKRELDQVESKATAGAAKSPSAKASTKRAGKKASKKRAGKKASAKTASTQKSAAKRTAAAKATSGTSAAKKSGTKKAGTKKAGTKKAGTKKAASKKAASKKATGEGSS